MSKISTTNYQEYKKDKSLIFISKDFIRKAQSLKLEKIIRCDNSLCNRILPNYRPKDDDNKRYETYLKDGRHNFCDKYCLDDYNDIESRNKHKCFKCNVPVDPYNRVKEYKDTKYTNASSVYPKYCYDCRMNKHLDGVKKKYGNSYIKHLRYDLYPELEIYENKQSKIK